MNRILIVEDDASLGPAIQQTLKKEGFEVELATTLAGAQSAKHEDYSLILLDWMLPDGQGIDLLRDVKSTTPVIMLTARTDLVDKVLGLESGATDYVTKPFEPRELVARIRAQLRNATQREDSPQEELNHGKVRINRGERRAYFNNDEITLTKMEFELLFLLMANPKQIFSREKLLDKVWGYENYPTTRTVDTHVLQLRQKFDNQIIETIRGVGYRFGSGE